MRRNVLRPFAPSVLVCLLGCQSDPGSPPADAPHPTWVRTRGGALHDRPVALDATSAGDLVVARVEAGATRDWGADGPYDEVIVERLAADGSLRWSRRWTAPLRVAEPTLRTVAFDGAGRAVWLGTESDGPLRGVAFEPTGVVAWDARWPVAAEQGAATTSLLGAVPAASGLRLYGTGPSGAHAWAGALWSADVDPAGRMTHRQLAGEDLVFWDETDDGVRALPGPFPYPGRDPIRADLVVWNGRSFGHRVSWALVTHGSAEGTVRGAVDRDHSRETIFALAALRAPLAQMVGTSVGGRAAESSCLTITICAHDTCEDDAPVHEQKFQIDPGGWCRLTAILAVPEGDRTQGLVAGSSGTPNGADGASPAPVFFARDSAAAEAGRVVRLPGLREALAMGRGTSGDALVVGPLLDERDDAVGLVRVSDPLGLARPTEPVRLPVARRSPTAPVRMAVGPAGDVLVGSDIELALFTEDGHLRWRRSGVLETGTLTVRDVAAAADGGARLALGGNRYPGDTILAVDAVGGTTTARRVAGTVLALAVGDEGMACDLVREAATTALTCTKGDVRWSRTFADAPANLACADGAVVVAGVTGDRLWLERIAPDGQPLGRYEVDDSFTFTGDARPLSGGLPSDVGLRVTNGVFEVSRPVPALSGQPGGRRFYTGSFDTATVTTACCADALRGDLAISALVDPVEPSVTLVGTGRAGHPPWARRFPLAGAPDVARVDALAAGGGVLSTVTAAVTGTRDAWYLRFDDDGQLPGTCPSGLSEAVEDPNALVRFERARTRLDAGPGGPGQTAVLDEGAEADAAETRVLARVEPDQGTSQCTEAGRTTTDIRITVLGEGEVRVRPGEGGCAGPCETTVTLPRDTAVTFDAEAAPGWQFAGADGECTSLTVLAARPLACTFTFVPETPPPPEPEPDLGVAPPPEPDLGVAPPPEPDLGVAPPPEPDLGVAPPPEPDLGGPPPPEPDLGGPPPPEPDMGVAPPGVPELEAPGGFIEFFGTLTPDDAGWAAADADCQFEFPGLHARDVHAFVHAGGMPRDVRVVVYSDIGAIVHLFGPPYDLDTYDDCRGGSDSSTVTFSDGRHGDWATEASVARVTVQPGERLHVVVSTGFSNAFAEFGDYQVVVESL
jgi:hypothetical protein